MTRPFEAYRSRKRDEVNARYAVFLAGGMTVDFGQGPETLQCRNELDRTNWMELRDICREASAAGFGDAPIPEPGLRCTSNAFYRPTFDETLTLLAGLRQWALTGQANWWRLKDLVRDCPTRDALNDIDLEEGWP